VALFKPESLALFKPEYPSDPKHSISNTKS